MIFDQEKQNTVLIIKERKQTGEIWLNFDLTRLVYCNEYRYNTEKYKYPYILAFIKTNFKIFVNVIFN